MLYWVLLGILRPLFLAFYRLQVVGRGRVPRQGRLIVAANHSSALDPFMVALAVPRPVHFMAKEELFRNPLLAWLLRKVYVFPVRRGRVDREAMKSSLKVLESEQALGIFPEGTRSADGQTLPPQAGAARFALQTGSPVLPVALIGASKAMAKGRRRPNTGRLQVVIGNVIYPEKRQPGRASREEVDSLSLRIMDDITGMIRATEAHQQVGEDSL